MHSQSLEKTWSQTTFNKASTEIFYCPSFGGGGDQTIKGTDQGGGGRVFVEDK